MGIRSNWITYLACLSLGLCLCSSCTFVKASDIFGPSIQTEAEQLAAVSGRSDLPSQTVEYEGFTVSFNEKTHCPNWVSWVLTSEQVNGTEPRAKKFWKDFEVKGCADPADYRNTGYDRGHMAPAGDMKWSAKAMEDCFSMANICPQAKSLNSGAWGKLEEKCRKKALLDSVLVIVCGPVPERLPEAHIGNTGVAVPSRFFKVILSPYTTPPSAIGFIMSNSYVEGGMQAAAVSVDSVESLTGFDFFSALPDEVENIIEAKCDFPRWSRTK